MKQPKTHTLLHTHPTWPDKWNPYKKRDEVMFLFDKRITDALLSFAGWADGQYDCWACGCIDAPEEVPCGGTASIRTIGGFYREEYLRLGREWESWNAHQRASSETAEMLIQILKESE